MKYCDTWGENGLRKVQECEYQRSVYTHSDFGVIVDLLWGVENYCGINGGFFGECGSVGEVVGKVGGIVDGFWGGRGEGWGREWGEVVK